MRKKIVNTLGVVFIINKLEINDNIGNQTNQEILKYIDNNYFPTYSTNWINIYKNEDKIKI